MLMAIIALLMMIQCVHSVFRKIWSYYLFSSTQTHIKTRTHQYGWLHSSSDDVWWPCRPHSGFLSMMMMNCLLVTRYTLWFPLTSTCHIHGAVWNSNNIAFILCCLYWCFLCRPGRRGKCKTQSHFQGWQTDQGWQARWRRWKGWWTRKEQTSSPGLSQFCRRLGEKCSLQQRWYSSSAKYRKRSCNWWCRWEYVCWCCFYKTKKKRMTKIYAFTLTKLLCFVARFIRSDFLRFFLDIVWANIVSYICFLFCTISVPGATQRLFIKSKPYGMVTFCLTVLFIANTNPFSRIFTMWSATL